MLLGLCPTGMLQPTSGTAYIGGNDIRTNMAAIRESLGICPQFDILWPDISVQEHLQLYAVIKGATYEEAKIQAQQAAAEVRLLLLASGLCTSALARSAVLALLPSILHTLPLC